MTLVLANGCFDLLHVGHIRHLQEALEFGTHLVVAVTMDQYVGKGPYRPVENLDDRMEKIRALHIVSAVSACRDSIDALRQWKPAVFAKGQDYFYKTRPEELQHCKENWIRIMYTQTPKHSTSELIARIKRCA